jgi:hypothetical protein
MGGAVCAKYILCNPPAVARAINEQRLNEVKAENKQRLKDAMLDALGDVGDLVEAGSLNETQVQCYHDVCAVLDGDDKTFATAYDILRESLIVKGA